MKEREVDNNGGLENLEVAAVSKSLIRYGFCVKESRRGEKRVFFYFL